MATDEHLGVMLSSIRAITHVDIIRFHTRAPVVLPSRIDGQFLCLLKEHTTKGKPIYIVTHYVHPLELRDASTDALDRLASAGIPMFNQAPVLRGVNDDQDTFDQWNKLLIRHRVKPYYIASPVIKDGVNSRFAVPLKEVQILLRRYSKNCDGLGRPTLIVPVMGAKLTPEELEELMVKQGAHVRRTKIEIA
jgi:lysine 2,3-aminomutase